ncbi:MAG: hypothetical protein R2817_14095 [Flavobacteriales bacterium]
MRASQMTRSFALLAFLLSTTVLLAQGGIRLGIYQYEVGSDAYMDQGFGLGYDQDLTERTSFTASAMYFMTGEELEVCYRSNFHFADTDGPSVYMGPEVALRTGGLAGTGVPVGARLGLRGGLEGFFADLFGGIRYRIGSKELPLESGLNAEELPGVMFSFGLHIGFGWDGR